MKALGIRALFCAAVAILAAGLADPLVELASNSGLFGPGRFTDHSNLDVLPALFVSVLFVCALVLSRVRTILLSRLKSARDSITPAVVLRLLPAIFALQIAMLYGMETLEQFAVYGHALGGATWLGGPAAISLLAHGLFCLCASLIVARAVRAGARTVVRIVRILRAYMLFAARNTAPLVAALRSVVAVHELVPIVCRIGKRGPPLFVR